MHFGSNLPFPLLRIIVTVFLYFLVPKGTYTPALVRGIDREPSKTYIAVVGGKVALPCDIISPMVGDEVYLVLWYKGDIATPIYSLDSRRGHLVQARHSSSDHLSRRAYFNTIPRPALLEISSLVAEDEGEYRCRVDFRKAQTRNYQVAVKILIPPNKPKIRDSSGKIFEDIIGPYNEGDSLYLICDSKGGKPPPSVTWWRGEKIVDDTYDIIPSSVLVQNELLIERLNRKDLMAKLTCQSTNNNISEPVRTSVILDLNFRPLVVKIGGQKQSFSSGHSVQLKCTTHGSRPSANITWSKGGTRFKNVQEDVVTGGNMTVSVFSFTPTPEDHGRLIQCQSFNPKIPDSMIDDGWKLDVHYSPQLSLRLGNKLRHSNILEGNDVYFECTVKANPWVSETGWKFDGQELQTNISAGIIVSNQSLVLQKVRRVNRGKYSCTATNSEGYGESNHVYLRVQYTPICRPGQQTMYGAMLHYPVEIACEVEADPDDVNFRWEFNSSTGTVELVPTLTSGRKSVVHYIPRSDQDYGTLSCWGKNRVGLQKIPCFFIVIPAEPPSAVNNCTVTGETERSFRVSCFEGKDGGLNQFFQMEVRTPDSNLLMNVSAQTADFAARGLSPGSLYIVTLYAVNAKGKSKPITIRAATLATPESQTRKEDIWELSVNPLLFILLAIVGGIVLVAFAVVLYLKFHGCRKSTLKSIQKKSPTCTELDQKVCDHYMCEKPEDKSKQFVSENFVIIENTQPDVTCADRTSRKESVYWRKSPTSPDDPDHHINTCLTIKLPFHKESSDVNRRRLSGSSSTQSETANCPNSILLHHRPGDDHTSSEIISMSSLRHTDL